MIFSSAFPFGILVALQINIFFNIFSIITLEDKIYVIKFRKWLIEAKPILEHSEYHAQITKSSISSFSLPPP